MGPAEVSTTTTKVSGATLSDSMLRGEPREPFATKGDFTLAFAVDSVDKIEGMVGDSDIANGGKYILYYCYYYYYYYYQ